MNELQKEIIKSIVKISPTHTDYYNNMLATFPINTLCEMIGIDRNRYNYLVKTNCLIDVLINLMEKIVIENE